MLAYTCLCSTFTSSIFSASTMAFSSAFGVSVEVGTLSTSLFVLGYAFGPLIWGPFSELQGRKLPICIGLFGFTVFTFGAAAGKDIQTINDMSLFHWFLRLLPIGCCCCGLCRHVRQHSAWRGYRHLLCHGLHGSYAWPVHRRFHPNLLPRLEVESLFTWHHGCMRP